MNIKELIDLTRESALDDTIEPYLWSNVELMSALNRTIYKLVKPSLITDQTTTATTEIKLLSNLGWYPLDSRILQVRAARLEIDTTSNPLTITTEERLNANINGWREETGTPREVVPAAASGYLSIYPKFDDEGEVIGVSNISFSGVTISQTSGDFGDLAVGDEINVDDTTLNEGYLTVATAGTASFTVTTALVTEPNTSAIIRKVRDTLLMTVNRLLTSRYTTADIALATTITGLNEMHQEGLIDGIAAIAYMKPDSQTFDPNKANYHKGLFDEFKKDVRRDLIILNKPERSRVPRPGTSIYY